jgi:hypothetical protein
MEQEQPNSTNGYYQRDYIWNFDSMFWAGLIAAFFGFLGLVLRTALKSNCTKVKCCGMECEKEPSVVENETPNFAEQL